MKERGRKRESILHLHDRCVVPLTLTGSVISRPISVSLTSSKGFTRNQIVAFLTTIYRNCIVDSECEGNISILWIIRCSTVNNFVKVCAFINILSEVRVEYDINSQHPFFKIQQYRTSCLIWHTLANWCSVGPVLICQTISRSYTNKTVANITRVHCLRSKYSSIELHGAISRR